MTTFMIDKATIHIHSTGTVIEFAEGRSVHGEPEDTDTYRATAQRYGYGTDTLSLCIDHEIMHVALAAFLGLSDSPTMLAVRTDALDQTVMVRQLEEAAVLAVQQYARAAGVDLITRFQTGDIFQSAKASIPS